MSLREDRFGLPSNSYNRPYKNREDRFGLPSDRYETHYKRREDSYRRREDSYGRREEDNSRRERNLNQQFIQKRKYNRGIKERLSSSDQELNIFFERIIFQNLSQERSFNVKNEDLKDIIQVFLWTFSQSNISIQKQVLLLTNITKLIRELNRHFSLNFLKLKINETKEFYSEMISTFIRKLYIERVRFEDIDMITNNLFYLLNIICDSTILENIFKEMNINLTNQFMNLKKNSVIKKTRIKVNSTKSEKYFYTFMNSILSNVNQQSSNGSFMTLNIEVKTTICDLLFMIFEDQKNLIDYVYQTYLLRNSFSRPILLNLKDKLTNMSLRYYLPISYLLTNRRLKKYIQAEINAIINKVGERKGKQGFVDINLGSESAVKYLNMRINTTPELEEGEEESTFYKVREGNLKPSYTRINNTIPTIILIEYIIHSRLYFLNPNYVSQVRGITYTNNIAQIHYQLIDGYNPKQLLYKSLNRRTVDENRLIEFIYNGSQPIANRTLFKKWNRREDSEKFNLIEYLDSNQQKFIIPPSFNFPQIRTIYLMIFNILQIYQNGLNFVHSDFGFGNMMFDKSKIKISSTGEYIGFEEGFIKLVDFESSSIFIPFDILKPTEKYLIKKVENNYSTIVRNFVEYTDINPIGIKIYDIVRFILIELLKNIFDRNIGYTPTEFIYTLLQHFGKPYIQIQYKDMIKRFYQLFITLPLSDESFKNICLTISRNYIVRNYVFFNIIPTGYTADNVISYLRRYNNNGDLYCRKENFILPPLTERPTDIIPGYPTLTFSDLFTPEILIQSFSS
jgi:hypothetical protein